MTSGKLITFFASKRSIPLFSFFNIAFSLIIFLSVALFVEPVKQRVNLVTGTAFTLLISTIASVVTFTILYLLVSTLKKKNEALQEVTAELHQSHLYREALFSVISHDFRSPLLALNGLIDTFKTDQIDAESVKHLLGDIHTQNNTLLEMIDTLIHWSKQQIHGDEGMLQETFPLHHIVKSTISLYMQRIRTKNVMVVNRIGSETLCADSVSITLVIRNIFSNALKYVEQDKGKITISTEETEKEITIVMKDNGVGMTQEQVDAILTSDHLPHPEQGTSGERGHGIGLFLCNYFVRKNGGSLSCTSTRNQGTTFRITLPR